MFSTRTRDFVGIAERLLLGVTMGSQAQEAHGKSITVFRCQEEVQTTFRIWYPRVSHATEASRTYALENTVTDSELCRYITSF